MTDLTLPEPGPRWTTARKQTVVQAVRSGRLTLDEVCRRYALSEEEFVGWEKAIAQYGRHGLRVTRVQIYRDTEPGEPKVVRSRHYYACKY
jgi:transposase-like protein